MSLRTISNVLQDLTLITKIKKTMRSREAYGVLQNANGYTVGPFLHGVQIEHRQFGSYIFVKGSAENKKVLQKRAFVDVESYAEEYTWSLTNPIIALSEVVLYNEEYNILITIMPENIWATFSKALNIADNVEAVTEIKNNILLAAFREMDNSLAMIRKIEAA